MPETAAPTTSTLGQRIDVLLAPLYAEAEQHRTTLAQAQSQIAALQQQIEAANLGLSQIEGRMAQVVRSLAGDEPVIAAVLDGVSASDAPSVSEPAAAASPTDAADPGPVAEADQAPAPVEQAPQPEPPAAESEPVETGAAEPGETGAIASAVAEVISAETDATPEPAASEPAAEPPAADPTPAEPAKAETAAETGEVSTSTVPLDLDPEEDQAMVDEAASLLDGPPTPPPADIAAVAERAVAAAKELRDKSASEA